MINVTKFYYIIFALLTLAGGIMGFVSARSRVSLIAGIVAGVLLLVASWLLKEQRQTAFIIGLMVSILLAGKFIPDFIHKKAFVPGGLMSVLSAVGVVLTLLAWYRPR